MRFDDPKVVVFLGIATVAIFSTVFAFSYFSPAVLQRIPQNLGFPTKLYPQVPSERKTGSGTYQTGSKDEKTTTTKPTSTSPAPDKLPIPTMPENFTTSISLDETQLNQLIFSAFKGNSTFSTPHLSLSGDSIGVSLNLLSPIKGNVTAKATIKTVNSEVQLDLTEVKLNNFPMPEFLVDIVEKQLNSTLNGYLMKIPFLQIEKVYVADSKLVIEGKIPTEGLLIK